MFNAFFSLYNPEFQVVKIIKMLQNDVISTNLSRSKLFSLMVKDIEYTTKVHLMRCANPSRERDKSSLSKMYTKEAYGNLFVTGGSFIILEV